MYMGGPTVTDAHYFGSTGEAYDASQCRDEIKDGDILVVLNEGVVGFLLSAWPVAVTKSLGYFHSADYLDGWQKYEDSIKEARKLAEFYKMEVEK